jgi:hypothetical protein
MERHHRKPKSQGGKGTKPDHPNISMVSAKQHDAFHTLFGTAHPSVIARILTETWIPHDWEMIARKKK